MGIRKVFNFVASVEMFGRRKAESKKERRKKEKERRK